MRSRAIIVLIAFSLMLLTISAATAGNNGDGTTDTDSTQTWTQTVESADLVDLGLNTRTLGVVAVTGDTVSAQVTDSAKDVVTTDTWDVNVAVSNLTERCDNSDGITTNDCVDTAPLVLDKAHGSLSPDEVLTTADLSGVGAITNPSTISSGAGGTLSAAQTLFSGDGYQNDANAIGLYTETGTLSYDWDQAMTAASVTNPGDYVTSLFDSDVTVTLVE